MECRDVRKNLCAYREGMVPPEDRERMEQHLAACPSCSTALYELDRAAETIKGLREVDPPPWMKGKIMTRVREEAGRKKGFLQRLFYPLHVKVPLEALGMVLIAVVAVYVFKAVEPRMENLQAPSPKEPAIARQESPHPDKAPAAEASAKGEKAAPAAETGRKKAASLDLAGKASQMEAKKDRQAQPAPPSSPPPAEPEREVFAAKSAETPGTAESRMAQASPAPSAYAPAPPGAEIFPPKRPESPGAAAPRSGPKESPSVAVSPSRDASELKKARSMAPSLGAGARAKPEVAGLKMKAKDIRLAGAETVRVLSQLGAEAIVRDSGQAAEVITAEIRAEKVKELIERLGPIGEVEGRNLPPDFLAPDTALRIEIVPAR